MVNHVGKDKAAVASECVEYVLKCSQEAIEEKGVFNVAISGGSLPTILALAVETLKSGADVSKWHVFFSDERCVPLDHEDSNYKVVMGALLIPLGVPISQIHALEFQGSTQDMARNYETRLRHHFQNQVAHLKI